MPSLPARVLSTREGRYAILEADLGDGPEPAGILLEDPETDRLYLRLRRDWHVSAPDDDVLPYIEEDLNAKAAEMGAGALLSWLEENASNTVRVTDRRRTIVADFERTAERLYQQHVRSRVSAATHVRLTSLRSAAGQFLDNAEIQEEADWIEVPEGIRITDDMFAASIQGTSMEPLIPDGAVCLFRRFGAGSRRGKLVLVEELGRGTNERYTVKRYTSEKIQAGDGTWAHEAIVLEPLNPEHSPIVLEPEEERFRVLAEFVRVLF
jgi:phage repressor protein C with HTH and peptisase S24 domain